MTEHPNYARATDRERRTICRHCGGNLDGSISHVDAVCLEDDEAVYWLLRIRELQEEPYNLTTAEAIQRANEEEDSQ